MDLPAKPLQRSRIVENSPVYYGWIILIVGTLGLIMSSPGQTYSVSIFIERFIEDLGISRSLVSSLYMVGTIGGSLTLPFVGRLIDRRGSRLMVIVIALAFGLVCIYMGAVRNSLMLVLGFFGIRMLGQGSMTLVSRNVINQWWVRRRGVMMGISSLFLAVLGTGAFPPLINWLIKNFGWRTAYPILGVSVIALMVPIGYFFFRNQPELYGLEPDGELVAQIVAEDDSEPIEENWTVQQVIRTRAFWLILLGIASFNMFGTGITFHVVSIFADRGLSADTAANLFLPISIVTAVVALLSGLIIDRVEAKYLLVVALLMQTATLLLANFLTPSLVLLYSVIFGMTNGVTQTLMGVIWANYFGRANLGAISGVTFFFGAASSGLGPLWYGVGRDLMGSYGPALYASALFPLVLAILSFTIKRPRLADLSVNSEQ